MATRWQIYWLFIVNVAAIVLPLADRRCKAICNPPIYCRCFSIRLICSDEGMKTALRQQNSATSSLLIYFAAYKGLLLTLALLSSLITHYDTSVDILGASHLMHWDLVWFLAIAERGYHLEQEFAFGPLLPALLQHIHPIVLGCVAHWIAVLSLYKLTLYKTNSIRIAKMSALLHIISPAGIFLCTGYTESLFVALMFTGLYLLPRHPFLSACFLGCASATRATGILHVLLFLPLQLKILSLFRFALLSAITTVPFLLTQLYAYLLYCPGRPWCSTSIPLIYGFVQNHYWDVGFLRYYKISNLPLFIMAAPMLCLCFYTAEYNSLGCIQFILSLTTLLTAHVQIITRMSSAFPGLYWFTARRLVDEPRRWKVVPISWVLYGMIQAVLFGAYLPPA